MATKYKLPYTGDEISGKLEKVDNIMNQIIDPDNYLLSEDVVEDTTTTIVLEDGIVNRNTGELRDDYDGLRTPDFMPVEESDELTFYYDETTYGRVGILFYTSDYTFMSDWNGGVGYIYQVPNTALSCPSGAAFFKAFFATEVNEGSLTFAYNVGKAITTRAEFKKIYIADHGYSIYGDIIDDETMHKVVIEAEGKDDNSYNITEIKAPDSNPQEATLALMNKGNGLVQFVDFSSMVYHPDEPTVEIVCQTRGDRPLPEFSIRYNNGNGAGRVGKFAITPDCIPIKLTSTGIEVRRNNNYDNDATDEELVTVNLADLYDKVNVIYDALVANGTITE